MNNKHEFNHTTTCFACGKIIIRDSNYYRSDQQPCNDCKIIDESKQENFSFNVEGVKLTSSQYYLYLSLNESTKLFHKMQSKRSEFEHLRNEFLETFMQYLKLKY